MITPLVEKAILSGLGTLRCYNLGAGGLCKIDVPEGHFGIITDFTYFPYVYQFNVDDANLQADTEFLTFQEVCFYVNQKTYKYTFRVNFSGYNVGPTTHGYVPVNAANKVDTYIYCDTDVYLQFKNPQILNGAGAVTDFGLLTLNQNLPSPETCGSTNNTVKQIANQYGDLYFFPSFDEAGGIAAKTNSTTINSNNLQELYPNTIGGAPTSNIQLPLCQVHMLLVAEQNLNKLSS